MRTGIGAIGTCTSSEALGGVRICAALGWSAATAAIATTSNVSLAAAFT
jgi:hypothetical protein